MPRSGIPSWFFALTVVRLGRRFLVVQERRQQLWYLPGGRVEPGESLLHAAQRHCRDEAAIPVTINGLLRVQHTPRSDGTARIRAIFTGVPSDDTPPKANPDEHTLRAAWVTLEEVERLPLRGKEVLDLFRYVDGGGLIHPLDMLAPETMGFRKRR